MAVKYSKERFDGYTHRFIVRFSVDDDYDTLVHIYSNSGSRDELVKSIESKKTDKITAYVIEHVATKEQDDAASDFVDWVFSEIEAKSEQALTLDIIDSYGFDRRIDDSCGYDDMGYIYTLKNGIELSCLYISGFSPVKSISLEGVGGFIYIQTKEELDYYNSKTAEDICNELAAKHSNFSVKECGHYFGIYQD